MTRSHAISDVIRQVTREFAVHPYDINRGRCEDFARRVIELVPDASEFDPGIDAVGIGHVCIAHEGLFYDAEEPEGVTRWSDLPLFVRAARRRYEDAHDAATGKETASRTG